MRALLEETTYKEITKDPTAATERKIQKEIKKLEDQGYITKEQARKMKPVSSISPKLYGLPKVHKPDKPMRPIVSSINSMDWLST